MGDDLFTMPDDSLNFGVDPGFDLGSQPMLPMMPQDPGSLYSPMLPFDPTQDPSLQIPGLPGFNLPGVSAGGGSGGSSAGGIDWGKIIMAALGIGSGFYGRNTAQHASDQLVSAYRDANTQATNILGAGNQTFQPYMDLGKYAANGLQQLPLTGIAGNFNSLGTGRGIKLGTLAGH